MIVSDLIEELYKCYSMNAEIKFSADFVELKLVDHKLKFVKIEESKDKSEVIIRLEGGSYI